MIQELILALDISSKTGYSVMISKESGVELITYGTLPQIHQPEGKYPGVFVDWADMVFMELKKLINTYKPNILAIEETVAGSKAVYSQKFLEFCHFLLAQYIRDNNLRCTYLLTGAWRSEVGAKMTKAESKHNKYVRDYKKKNNTKTARDINGKRVGKLTKKHINIRRANEIFEDFLDRPLRKKEEDQADALLLGYTVHLRRFKKKSEETTMDDIIKGNL